MPWAPYYNGQYESTGTILAREVVDAYFEITKKNEAVEELESSTLRTIKPAFSETLIKEGTEDEISE
jgi:hypothetical protein